MIGRCWHKAMPMSILAETLEKFDRKVAQNSVKYTKKPQNPCNACKIGV